ncbi:phosphatase domain-containing protein [Spirosoma sp. SC4-14]|uniref:App1 family protein n=1 Tax=Spirosoma sp. SC4-14 TaxID=3128900 RepID=UPI0030CE3393
MNSEQHLSLKGKLTNYVLKQLRLTNQPLVKVYRGFGNDQRITVHGHAFRRSALPRKNYRNKPLVNLLAVIRLFLAIPYPKVTIRVLFNELVMETQTDADGYFRVDLPLPKPLSPGWHPVKAELISQTLMPEKILAEGEGLVLIPNTTPFICVSDIDDTFLVSHSATITKRLRVLLTQNAHSRDPFEGVVAHYRLLAEAVSGPGATNPFFYVSSSEWNLYDYILEFSRKNGLPDGIYLLSQLKQLSQVLQTGKTKHLTKFERIVRIMETYSDQQFILLGDDSQQDPPIYESIVRHFRQQVRCVYIRRIRPKKQHQTQSLVEAIEAMGVSCCYFANSAEAHQHSLRIGLVAS